ncbi:DMT family transporter [Cohnella thailandensis]|uniref:DMT family transporter n=2 Tax=Cohnella thailandensis TaxID=557557 RepID=A0A841SUY3_9BACL|nr:DMT family transporter [Cohnella thailandensis]MBB6636123.1 DMT family transporter [Cohnella thailandensis]
MVAISFAPILVRFSDAPVSVQGMYRMLFTILVMLPFGAKQAGAARRISGKDWLLLGLAGFFLALHFLLWMASLTYTSIASSTIILSLEPVLVMIGAYFAFKERSSRRALLGMLLAILGVVTVGSGDSGGSGDALLGDLLSFLGTLAIVANMLIAKRLMSRIPSYLYSLIAFAITFLCFALYNLATGTPMFDYPAREWLLFVLLAVVPTVLGHMIFNWLLQHVKATTISMTVLAEPVGASILGIFLFGEYLGAAQLAGGACVIVGLILYMRSEQNGAAQETPEALAG